MLASITPLGERGRHSHYAVTVIAFSLAGVLAGAALGAALGALGGVVLGGTGPGPRLTALAIVLGVALVVDLGPGAVPGPRRQVNERWLDAYRGWVYGTGFGGQLGIGVTTVVSSAATYAALLAALLCGSTASGALVLGSYGAIRGLTPLLAVRVRTPEQLLALHRRLARAQRPATAAGYALLAAATVVAATGALA
jgi:sulfite exporter TauE/SafE